MNSPRTRSTKMYDTFRMFYYKRIITLSRISLYIASARVASTVLIETSRTYSPASAVGRRTAMRQSERAIIRDFEKRKKKKQALTRGARERAGAKKRCGKPTRSRRLRRYRSVFARSLRRYGLPRPAKPQRARSREAGYAKNLVTRDCYVNRARNSLVSSR